MQPWKLSGPSGDSEEPRKTLIILCLSSSHTLFLDCLRLGQSHSSWQSRQIRLSSLLPKFGISDPPHFLHPGLTRSVGHLRNKNHTESGVRQIVPHLELPSCMTLSGSLSHSEPQFPPPHNGPTESTVHKQPRLSMRRTCGACRRGGPLAGLGRISPLSSPQPLTLPSLTQHPPASCSCSPKRVRKCENAMLKWPRFPAQHKAQSLQGSQQGR